MSTTLILPALGTKSPATRKSPGMMVLYGPPKVGKALTLDSHIFTNKGWIRMGDINTEHKVAARNGNFYSINGIYPQDVQDIYRVEFTDGTWVDCSGDHIWIV